MRGGGMGAKRGEGVARLAPYGHDEFEPGAGAGVGWRVGRIEGVGGARREASGAACGGGGDWVPRSETPLRSGPQRDRLRPSQLPIPHSTPCSGPTRPQLETSTRAPPFPPSPIVPPCISGVLRIPLPPPSPSSARALPRLRLHSFPPLAQTGTSPTHTYTRTHTHTHTPPRLPLAPPSRYDPTLYASHGRASRAAVLADLAEVSQRPLWQVSAKPARQTRTPSAIIGVGGFTVTSALADTRVGGGGGVAVVALAGETANRLPSAIVGVGDLYQCCGGCESEGWGITMVGLLWQARAEPARQPPSAPVPLPQSLAWGWWPVQAL
jgi:hypothetical protein